MTSLLAGNPPTPPSVAGAPTQAPQAAGPFTLRRQRVVRCEQ